MTHSKRIHSPLEAIRSETGLTPAHLLMPLRHGLQLLRQKVPEGGVRDQHFARLRVTRARQAAALSARFDRLLDQVIYGCLFAAKHCVTENCPESA